MDYDSLSEEELKRQLATVSPTDLEERIKLRAALERRQARKNEKGKWTREQKIAVAATIVVPLLIAAVGGTYKLLRPDKPNSAPVQQTETSKPPVPATPSDTQPKATPPLETPPKKTPAGPAIVPIPNPPLVPAAKIQHNFAKAAPAQTSRTGSAEYPPLAAHKDAFPIDDPATKPLIDSTWAGQLPVVNGKVGEHVNVHYRFLAWRRVLVECDKQDARRDVRCFHLPSGIWTLYRDGTLEIDFSGVIEAPSAPTASAGPETNEPKMRTKEKKPEMRAEGKMEGDSIQGHLATGDLTVDWTLTKQ